MTKPTLMPPDDDDPRKPLHPLDEALKQGEESGASISRLPDKFLHLPWASLDDLVGGIAPGEIWFVGAYSGHGKTTFLMSALDQWYNRNKRIFYLGLESKPATLRTQWACQRLGLNAGDVLSGKLTAESAEWPFTRKRIIDEIHHQTLDDRAERVYFCPSKFVNPTMLRECYEQAADLGSDVMVIDHVDHLEGTAGSVWENSIQVHKVMLDAGQSTGVRTIAATQFNNDMIRGNRLGMHLPPTPTAVYMGGHKRMMGHGMLGLYKPLKHDITPDEMKRFSRGELEPQDVVERGVMACLLMKSRHYGEREGRRVLLKVDRGTVSDIPYPVGSSYSPKPWGKS